MRFVAVSSLLALVVSVSAALAQDSGQATAPDPSLDALSQPQEPESELDTLSRTPDDPFPNLDDAKKRMPVSVTIRALDKITARYIDIEAPIGESAKFGSLEILARFCDKRPPEEFPETTAFLEIFDRDLARARASAAVEARSLKEQDVKKEDQPTSDYQVEEIPALAVDPVAPAPAAIEEAPVAPQTPSAPIDPDRIFAGWMFASSPALNPLEHPIYDVWVIDCKTVVVDK